MQLPPQVSDADVPQESVGGHVCEQHVPPRQVCPVGHSVPVPGHVSPGHALGTGAPQATAATGGHDAAHWHVPPAVHTCPEGHMVPRPHEGPPAHTLEMGAPHATVDAMVVHEGMHWHVPPMHA